MFTQDPAHHQFFTEAELVQALRLLDPRIVNPDRVFVRALMGAPIPTGVPTGMNFRLFVALSLVSTKVQEFTKDWLTTVPDNVRALFEKERNELRARQTPGGAK